MNRYEELRAFDEELVKECGGPFVGIDEVGVATLAGPVAACALILRSFDNLEGVDDCKVLTPAQRLDAYETILPQILEFQVAFLSPSKIDEINNISKASQAVRGRAFQSLRSASKAKLVVIDGNFKDSYSLPCKAIVKADAKSLTVAAASILAKVSRDRLMIDLARTYPQYGWSTNKGYPTERHTQAIRDFGVTPYHRRSFRPVRNAQREQGEYKLTVDRNLKSLRQP